MSTLTRRSLASSPTLLSGVLSYLPRSDLAACLRVNREFYEAAGAHLYRHLIIDESTPISAIDQHGLITHLDRDAGVAPILLERSLLRYTEIISLRGSYRSRGGRRRTGEGTGKLSRLEAVHVNIWGRDEDLSWELDAVRALEPKLLVFRDDRQRIGRRRQIQQWADYLTSSRQSNSAVKRVTLVALDLGEILETILAFRQSGLGIPMTVLLPDYSHESNWTRCYNVDTITHHMPLSYPNLTFVHGAYAEFPPYMSFQEFWETAPQPQSSLSPQTTKGPENYTATTTPDTPKTTFISFSDFMATREGALSVTHEEEGLWYKVEEEDLSQRQYV